MLRRNQWIHRGVGLSRLLVHGIGIIVLILIVNISFLFRLITMAGSPRVPFITCRPQRTSCGAPMLTTASPSLSTSLSPPQHVRANKIYTFNLLLYIFQLFIRVLLPLWRPHVRGMPMATSQSPALLAELSATATWPLYGLLLFCFS